MQRPSARSIVPSVSDVSSDTVHEHQPPFKTMRRDIECLLNDNHQKGKMMIMIMKTSGSQVDSPVVEGNANHGRTFETEKSNINTHGYNSKAMGS